MTVTPDQSKLRTDFSNLIARYVQVLKRAHYTAAESEAFAKWRQQWYDMASKQLGVHTLATKKRSE